MEPDPAESALVAAAAGGDERALERLLLAHYDRLARRIARRLPADLHPTVSEEDILQQTLVVASREITGFEPRGRHALYRWLCAIAEFRLRDEIKRRRAAKRGGQTRVVGEPDGWPESRAHLVELLAGARRTPSRSVAHHEAVSAVQAAIETLTPDHRQAIELRFVQGLPAADVAQTMGRSPHAVHNLCSRALRELRARLGRSSKYVTRR